IARTALTRPNPDWGFQVPAGVLFIGKAPAISPWRIWAGVRLGTFCSIKAATAAALGVADEVPKKLGRFCDRLVVVAGSPGKGGWLVSMIPPGGKNDVLQPSGAVIVGFWASWGVDIVVPA